MALVIDLLPGETLIFEDGVVEPGDDVSSARPFVFGVSDRAIYVTLEQHFKQESWRLERIPIEEVSAVTLRKERPVVLSGARRVDVRGRFAAGGWLDLERL